MSHHQIQERLSMTSQIVDAEKDFLDVAKTSWARSGRPATVPLSDGRCECDYPRCRNMPFVTLKTDQGPRALCFTHFDLVGLPSSRRAGRAA
jgi:hypothetical protein